MKALNQAVGSFDRLGMRLDAWLYNKTHTLTCKCEHCGAIVQNIGGHYGPFGCVVWCYFPKTCPACRK